MKTAIFFHCALFIFLPALLACNPAGAAEIRSLAGGGPAILVEGEIKTGDSLKLKNLLGKLSRGGKTGEVVFDSQGGNFMEGIFMGMDIFDKGWATRVKADGICYSSCAIAFLGGRYKIEGSGWLPDRNLEAGATLGFHSFYVDDKLQGSVAKSMDAGKDIANIFYAYSNMLEIRPEALVKMLDIAPDHLLVAATPDLLRDLSINLTGLGKMESTRLDAKGAINAARTLIEKREPFILNENENNWRLRPKAGVISAREFRKEILRRLVEPLGGHSLGSLSGAIASALANERKIDSIYEDLARMDLTPRIGAEDKIIKVSGLDHVNPYMGRIAYFIGRNEGTPEFSVDYLICPAPSVGGQCDSGSLRRYGDIIYELHSRDEPLWKIR